MSCWLCLLFTLQQTTLLPLLQAGLGHRPLLLGQLQEPPEGALLPAPQPSYSFASLRAEAAVLPVACRHIPSAASSLLSGDTAPSYSSHPPLPSCLGPLCLCLSRSCSDISSLVRPSLIPSFKVTHTHTHTHTHTPVPCTLPVAFSSFIFLYSI